MLVSENHRREILGTFPHKQELQLMTQGGNKYLTFGTGQAQTRLIPSRLVDDAFIERMKQNKAYENGLESGGLLSETNSLIHYNMRV